MNVQYWLHLYPLHADRYEQEGWLEFVVLSLLEHRQHECLLLQMVPQIHSL